LLHFFIQSSFIILFQNKNFFRLGNIYNYLEVNSPVRPDVYVCILKFAAKTNKMNVILPSLENLDTWMDEWKVTLQKRREIYLLVREMLTKTGFQ